MQVNAGIFTPLGRASSSNVKHSGTILSSTGDHPKHSPIVDLLVNVFLMMSKSKF
jgi:hypothetical protein